LLQTYDSERRANRLSLERIQISTLKYTLPAPRLNRFILRHYGNGLLNRFWPAMAKAFSQLGVNYEKSPLTLKGAVSKGVRSGQRVRDADVLRASDATEVSLFKELCAPIWKLVLFDGGTSIPTSALPESNTLPRIKTYVVIAGDDARHDGGHIYQDLDRVAHRAYDITEPTVLLIRPDNYIAAVLPGKDLLSLHRYLATWYPNRGSANAIEHPGPSAFGKRKEAAPT
jgi:hypothetical protein